MPRLHADVWRWTLGFEDMFVRTDNGASLSIQSHRLILV